MSRDYYDQSRVNNHNVPRRQQPRTINGGATRPFIPCERGGVAPVPPAGRKRSPKGGR